MRRAPLLVPAIAFLTAIVLDAHALTFAAIVWAVALCVVRRDAAVGMLLGSIAGVMHGHPASVAHDSPTSRYAGTVVGDVRSEDGSVQFPFAVDGWGTLRAVGHGTVRAGERLLVRGRIGPIDGARNPGEPSARALALDDGIAGEITVQQLIDRRAPDSGDPRVWAPIARERLSSVVRSALPEPQATLLAGALWGERGTLPQAERDDFQATGTVHVLVTAGLHLGVIAALVGGGFALMRVPRVAAAVATIPFLYGYAWLSGWHLPSQRAAVMLSVALLARACGARAVSLNTLAIAAIVVGALWPISVESASFALSFSCVAAIVLFAEPIAERLAIWRVPHTVAEALALTVSTQVGVWPLTAAIFFVVAPYAIVANAIVVPLVAGAMSLGIATVLSHPIGALTAIFAQWTQWLLTLVLIATHTVAGLPGAKLTIGPPPLWAIIAYDVIVVIAAAILRTRPIVAGLLIAGACTTVCAAAHMPRTGEFAITTLDVGQGDAIVIRTPHGHTILIDTGGRLERGSSIDGRSPAERSADRIVLPYLQRAGITAIDLMVLSHPHGDHVGGCRGIVELFHVRQIFDSGQPYNGRAYADCKRAAAERSVPIRVVRRGVHWSTDDGVSLDILAPTVTPLIDTGDDVNENSIVARLRYTGSGAAFTALFMGDAGMAREVDLLGQHDELRTDLLKIGHHGSHYASTPAFIDAVRPRFAVISVGRHNLFGHPAAATIETLRRAGVSISRTDLCGAVTITLPVAARPKVTTMLPCTLARDSVLSKSYRF